MSFNAIIVFIMSWFSRTAIASRCEVSSYSLQGQILVNHTITSQPAWKIEDCITQCMSHPACFSSNFYQVQRMCDLSNKTHLSHPEDVVTASHTNYMENILRPYVCNRDSDCGLFLICSSTGDCKECRDEALGMENGTIKDSAITASSSWGDFHKPWFARLNNVPSGHTGSWSASNNSAGQWLQIDLRVTKVVSKLATQGRPSFPQWLTSYKIAFSADNITWEEYKESGVVKVFKGNSDSDSIESHKLSEKIRARYIRFVAVQWHNHISTRVELYGCSLL